MDIRAFTHFGLNAFAEPLQNGVSRRAFLKASAAAGGGLLISLALDCAEGDAEAATFAPNAFIRIDRDGAVTFVMPQVEMGQGTYTSMPMLIAEELEVDLSQVRLEHAPADEKLYGNPITKLQVTGGSRSVMGFWEPLRRAGATARNLLIAAAAQTWGVDADACRAEKGEVIHVPTGRSLFYGSLVDVAATLPVPEKVALKDPKDFKIIGTPVKRLDAPEKVNGTAQYGIDVRIPGMKVAAVAACPVFGGKLESVDDSKAKTIKGVVQIVRLDDAIAVVADHMAAAKKGLAALDIKWNEGQNARLETADIVAQLDAASKNPGVVARKDGDVEKAMAGATKKVEAIYQVPFLAHAPMEPMNCTVHVRDDGCDVWVGTQVAARAQRAAAEVTGLPFEKVQVHNHLLGGGFGRRLDIDGVTRAVQIAKQVSVPVKVIWSREEDIQHDLYRPYYYDRLAAGLDEQGMPVAWTDRVTGSSILARWLPVAFKNGFDRDAVEGAVKPPYTLPNIQVEYVRQEAAAWNCYGVLAGGWAHPQHLYGRELYRRARRGGQQGPGRLSARLARQFASCQGRARTCRREVGVGTKTTAGQRSRHFRPVRFWHLHVPGSRGSGREEWWGAGSARRLCRRLRNGRQSGHGASSDRGWDHFRHYRGALRPDHGKERTCRTKQFRQLSHAANQRSTDGGGVHHKEHRSARRHGRTRHRGGLSGGHQCDFRGNR